MFVNYCKVRTRSNVLVDVVEGALPSISGKHRREEGGKEKYEIQEYKNKRI